MATEEERAAEYRRMMQAREDNALANEKVTLAGDKTAAQELLEKTFPITRTSLRIGRWNPIRRVKDDAE